VNATVGDIVDGKLVTLSCSLKYQTCLSNSSSSQENVHIMIVHPGANLVATNTQRDANEINSVVTVKANHSKNSEHPTQFGPVQCRVEFSQPKNHSELAQNKVHFILC